MLAKCPRALMVSRATAAATVGSMGTESKVAKKSVRKAAPDDELPTIALLRVLTARLDAASASAEAHGLSPPPLELGNTLLRRAWWALLHRVGTFAATEFQSGGPSAANPPVGSPAAAWVASLATAAASVEHAGRAFVAYLHRHAARSGASVSGDEVTAIEAAVSAWRRCGSGGGESTDARAY